MINEKYAKSFCCEDISLIENYDKAIADTTQTWHCHHRGEVLPCGRFSVDDLKKFGLYYKRPASELIFLTPFAHLKLHKGGVHISEATKKAMSEAHSKKILQFTKSGEFIKEWPSMLETSSQLKINCGNICSCCNGIRKYAGGYIWKYASSAKI